MRMRMRIRYVVEFEGGMVVVDFLSQQKCSDDCGFGHRWGICSV